MRILFFLSMSGAAITFALFYTWCIQKPVMTVMRFFQGEDLPEEAPYGETEKLPPAVLPLVWYPLRIVSGRLIYWRPGGPIASSGP